MPKRYSKKRSTTKKRRSRRRRRYNPYRRLTSGMGTPSGMPKQRIAKLRYCSNISVISTLGALGSHTFGANDIYDPDITGTGHQPMGHDQWANLFNHYVVLGSKITVYPVQDAGIQGLCGVYLSDDTSTPYTSGDQFMEAKRGSYQIQSMTRGSRPVKAFFSAKKFFNVKDVKDNLDRLGAGVGTSPTDNAVFHVYFNTIDGNTDTMRFLVQIDYVVLFSEPKDLTQS